jgi:hypothetical protein
MYKTVEAALELESRIVEASDAFTLTPDPKKTLDLFVYPEATGYASIVEAVDGLPTPDLWRREMSSLYRAQYENAPTYRLYMRKLLYPGRCAICRRNNKSLSHCVLGQGTKNGASAATVDDNTLLRVHKFVIVATEMLAYGGGETQPGVFVFPHETDLDDPKKLYRVSQQHSFPTMDVLLRQRPFAAYFSPETFRPFFQERVVIGNKTRGAKKPGEKWIESEKGFQKRHKRYLQALAVSDDDARRASTAAALSECYIALIGTYCSEACEAMCRRRKGLLNIKITCDACKQVRGALKKHYIETMTKTVSGVINKLFSTRQGPFAGCPATIVGTRYVDAFCRVERVNQAKP